MASQSDLYTAALSEGLPPARATIAAAVGMGESGGNLTSHNTNAATGDNSYGAWQINMLGDLGPERRALFGITSNDQLFDLKTNARAMRILSANGADFSPWSAYKNGSYRQFMTTTVSDQGSNDPAWWQKILGATSPAYAAATAGGTVSDVAGSVGNAVELLTRSAVWISDAKNWLRVAYVVGGGVMLLQGLSMLAGGSGAAGIVTKVVPVGRAATVAKSVVNS